MRKAHLCLLLACALVACGGEHPYRVGLFGGDATFDAANLAAKEVNTTGRVNGRPIRLERSDTLVPKDPAAHAVTVARGFAADSAVKAVIQETGLAEERGASRAYDSAHLPALVMSPAFDTTRSPWVFHLLPRAENEAALLVDEAKRLWHPERVVIVRSPDEYGSAMGALVRARLGDAARVVLDTAYTVTQDTVPLSAFEKLLADAKPNVVFWLGGSRQLGAILPRLRVDVLDLRIIASDAAEAERVLQNRDCTFCGLVFARAVDPQTDTTKYNNFAFRFQMWVGRGATSSAVTAYDAIGLLAEALRSGATTRTQLRDYLASLGKTRPAYQGYSGPIAFDSTGASTRPLELAEVTEVGIRPVLEIAPKAPAARDTAAGDTAATARRNGSGTR